MTTTVYVLTMNGGKPKWSVYAFPFSIDSYTQLGNVLYIRSGNYVLRVNEDAATDDVAGVATNFTGTAWWHYLDFGQPGVTKMLEGFDYVGTGQAPSLAVGYDQRNLDAFTAAYAISNDTLPGTMIPLPVAAPTLSVKLTFAGGEAWEVLGLQLYVDDMKGQP